MYLSTSIIAPYRPTIAPPGILPESSFYAIVKFAKVLVAVPTHSKQSRLPSRSLAFHLLDEVLIVLPCAHRKMMLVTKLLLIDCQGPPQERLGLLILALSIVEQGQVVEIDRQAGMLGA